MTKRPLLLTLLVLCLSATLFADPLVQGTASGAFYSGASNRGTQVANLSYTGTAFGPTSNTVLNLGQFSLGYGNANYDPYTFRLSLNFDVPAGAGGTTATADVTGSVYFFGLLGGAEIDFSSAPKTFTYANGSGSGSFNLTLSDVSLSPGESKTLYGTISNATFAAVPEPASVVLMATLFGGVAFGLRKRLVR